MGMLPDGSYLLVWDITVVCLADRFTVTKRSKSGYGTTQATSITLIRMNG